MDKNKFADRVGNLTPSPIRKMMAIAKELMANGKTVYELNIGQPDIECIPEFTEAISRKAAARKINYSPFIGENYLRETYSRYLNHYFDSRKLPHIAVDTENVMVTVGASHALSSTFLAICDPGDDILVIEPFFTPYIGFLAVSGALIRAIPTKAEENFALPTEEEIEKYITPKTRAILFNSPCNPTGKIYDPEEVEKLASICIKHNIFLISDEVYREMALGDKQPFSILQIDFKDEAKNEKLKNSMIIIDSASKSFSLCGVRIGFVISKPHILAKIALVCAHTVACASDILQYGVAAAYDAIISNPEYLENMRKTYKKRLEATMQAISDYLPNAVAPRPEGAFYLMLKFPDMDDVTEFCHYVLEKFNLAGETVAMTPAGSFYPTTGRGKNEVRIAMVLDPIKMRRAIQIISEGLKAYKAFEANQIRSTL